MHTARLIAVKLEPGLLQVASWVCLILWVAVNVHRRNHLMVKIKWEEIPGRMSFGSNRAYRGFIHDASVARAKIEMVGWADTSTYRKRNDLLGHKCLGVERTKWTWKGGWWKSERLTVALEWHGVKWLWPSWHVILAFENLSQQQVNGWKLKQVKKSNGLVMIWQ